MLSNVEPYQGTRVHWLSFIFSSNARTGLWLANIQTRWGLPHSEQGLQACSLAIHHNSVVTLLHGCYGFALDRPADEQCHW
jgi:hypothetical protein